MSSTRGALDTPPHPGAGSDKPPPRGYDRQNAQRIHDLGERSKESWVTRLWNRLTRPSDEPSGSREAFVETRPTDNMDTAMLSRPPLTLKPPQISVLPPIGGQAATAPRDALSKEMDAFTQTQTDILTSSLSPDDTLVSEHVTRPATKTPLPLALRDNALPSIQGITLAPMFADSPYLPKTERASNKLPKLNGSAKDPLRSAPTPPPGLSKSHTVLGVGSMGGGGSVENGITRRRTNPHLTGSQDSWKPKMARAMAQNQLEKRAKLTSERAIKANKIFTCFAPYPVDAFVRHSLRKRGWVEKFNPRVFGDPSSAGTTESKFQCNSDEDFEIICDQSIPKPWEEDCGIYLMMSRIVSRYPAKFIWGNRSVNHLVLKSDVIVNHFPKAKYFSSKVLLASSLRELPWQNSTTSLTFFPRCYLLNEDDEMDFIDDFRITACMALLNIILYREDKTQSEDSSQASTSLDANNHQHSSAATAASQRSDSGVHATHVTASAAQTSNGVKDTYAGQNWLSSLSDQPASGQSRANVRVETSQEVAIEKSQGGETTDAGVNKSESGDEVGVDVGGGDDPILLTKALPLKVAPDLSSCARVRKGGMVNIKCVEWALQQCDAFIKSKHHDDLDKRRRGLDGDQWDLLLSWFYQISQDGATVQVSASKLHECRAMVQRMREVWPQADIDGLHNMWIVKPGDKSKGIGIKFCDNLDEILKFICDPETQDHIVQKYIERPLLIYNCKFDIRQWFLVTEWTPLTVWFYRVSYLRICSQEFSYDTMHESVHLSNVAVQENYVNGQRSDKLPENNFMTSEQFQVYLSETGGGGMWEDKIYPGMKEAVLDTLIATQDVSDTRKSGFELYGADFMMSEDYTPWLLEVNSSPGMLPSSIEKAKLCSAVIEDTIKVVLDYRENSGCDTGRFELIHHDTTNPHTRGLDTKLLLEGLRIRKTELQKYTVFDQHVSKLERDKEQQEKERLEREKAGETAEHPARQGVAMDSVVELSEVVEALRLNKSGAENGAATDNIAAQYARLPDIESGGHARKEHSKGSLSEQRPGVDPAFKGKGREKSVPGLRSSIVDIYGGTGQKPKSKNSTAKYGY